MTNYSNVPDEMKKLNNWVCYEAKPKDDGRTDKIPINPKTGGKASSTNPNTWSNFDTAVDAVEKLKCTGIMFAFHGSGFVGTDLDHCINPMAGEVISIALEIVATLDTYTEFSPSGEGLHSIAMGDLPPGKRKNSKLGVEMYEKARFFTMTGNVFRGYRQLRECTDAIAKVHAKYLGAAATKKVSGWINQKPFTAKDNEKVIARVKEGKNGAKFSDLLIGVWEKHHDSQSEADLGFCSILARYTNGNPAQIDAIFRSSGLMRDKWDEMHGNNTYGQMTIQIAIDFYNANRFPHVDSKGLPMKHWENTQAVLNQNELVFKYNELSNEIECDADRLKNLSFEAMITEINGLCLESGYSITEGMLNAHIRRVAELNRFNPVRDYLLTCKNGWNGKSVIRDLYKTLVLDDECDQDEEFAFLLFKKWLVTCALMAFNDDGTTSAQGMLVLKGKQGIGKTRWLQSISPNASWVKDGLQLDPSNKDDVMKVCRYWIVELGELKSTIRREKLDDLKNFITNSTDTYRAPYDRATKQYPRMTALFGTVNDDSFLKDMTGERRYWVISVKDIRTSKGVDLAQLWGEVSHLAIDKGFPHYLTQDEIDLLECSNEKYKVRTPEEQLLLDSLDWYADQQYWGYLNASEMCELLNLPPSRNVPVGKALKSLEKMGIQCPRNNRFRKYKCPPFRDVVKRSRVHDFYPEYKHSLQLVKTQ